MTSKLVLPETASPKWRLAFGFLEDRWNTKRRVVDAKAVAMAIMPHLPGEWGVSADAAQWEGEGYDGGALHRFQIERAADGLTLFVSSDTRHGREFGARFSLGNYRDARGEVITIRVGGDSIEPVARVNLEKRDPAAVAKDIIRRVIKPGEDVLVSIRLRQENVAKAVADRDARRAAIWPEASDAELSQDAGGLKEALIERLPKLLDEFCHAIGSAGLIWPDVKK